MKRLPFSFLIATALLSNLVACGGGEDDTGTAGAGGSSAGNAGSASAGKAGTAGTSAGAAGTTSAGSAGTTSAGSAGTTAAGSAGTTAAGSAGTAGTGQAGGGASGSSGSSASGSAGSAGVAGSSGNAGAGGGAGGGAGTAGASGVAGSAGTGGTTAGSGGGGAAGSAGGGAGNAGTAGTASSTCGNGALDAGEECDDTNTKNDDGCSSTCKVETCGDGIVQAKEDCEPGGPLAPCDATTCKYCSGPHYALGPNGSCYFSDPGADVPLAMAATSCAALGAGWSLFTPGTKDEIKTFDDAFGTPTPVSWTSGGDAKIEGFYTWANGEPFTYVNATSPWQGSNPDNASDEDGIMMNATNMQTQALNDASVTSNARTACERVPASCSELHKILPALPNGIYVVDPAGPVGAHPTYCDFSQPDLAPATTCKQLHADKPTLPSAHYVLDPDGAGGVEPVFTYCDMETDGGGWTLVLSTANTIGPDVIAAFGASTGIGPFANGMLDKAYLPLLLPATGQIHLRTTGDVTRSFTSKADGGKLVSNLRAGLSLRDGFADGMAVLAELSGPFAQSSTVDFTCADACTGGYPCLYHACGNTMGLHLEFNLSVWVYQSGDTTKNEPMSLWVR